MLAESREPWLTVETEARTFKTIIQNTKTQITKTKLDNKDLNIIFFIILIIKYKFSIKTILHFLVYISTLIYLENINLINKQITINCPNCNIPLQMTQREWIEIDYCPTYRWIWLNRWEIDQLIQRESKYHNNSSSQQTQNNNYQNQNSWYNENKNYENKHYDKHWYNNNSEYKKKESFLWELFDF